MEGYWKSVRVTLVGIGADMREIVDAMGFSCTEERERTRERKEVRGEECE